MTCDVSGELDRGPCAGIAGTTGADSRLLVSVNYFGAVELAEGFRPDAVVTVSWDAMPTTLPFHLGSQAMTESAEDVVISGEGRLLDVQDFSSDMQRLRNLFDLFGKHDLQAVTHMLRDLRQVLGPLERELLGQQRGPFGVRRTRPS